jgi:hypothetical protein
MFIGLSASLTSGAAAAVGDDMRGGEVESQVVSEE